MGSLNIIAAAISHRDFQGAGGEEALRNSGIPDMHVQLHYNSDNIVAGVGAGYKIYKPALSTTVTVTPASTTVDTNTFTVTTTEALTKTTKATETIGAISALAFAKIKTKPVTFKLEGFYGQNSYDMLGISSYAVKSLVDTASGAVDYTTTSNYAVWTDIHTNGEKFEFGVFAGYTANLGVTEQMDTVGSSFADQIAGSRDNIESVMRVSPRVIFKQGKARFAGEIEYTAASFGSPDAEGLIIDAKDVANIRFLLGVYLFF
jgi:hypothetical protein